MTMIERVIKGFDCCLSEDGDTETCNGCPYDNEDTPFCNEHLLRDALILLRARQWISVKDRLPPEDKMVLVWHGSCEIGCLERDPYIHELRWSFNDFYLYGNDMEQVIAWMPLPEPPKEGT